MYNTIPKLSFSLHLSLRWFQHSQHNI